jgi:hypothetical protein
VAAVLVLLPIVGPLVMSGGLVGGPMVFGIHVGGLMWLLATFIVIAALAVWLRREASRT